jgi:hypothetical protein
VFGMKKRRESAVFRGPKDDPSLTDDELIAQREQWFEQYVEAENVFASRGDGPYACPCCHFLTLDERGGYDICPVCFWEDDGQDDHDADVVRGGPNGALSLRVARQNFKLIGASDTRSLPHVRAPRPSESPPRA